VVGISGPDGRNRAWPAAAAGSADVRSVWQAGERLGALAQAAGAHADQIVQKLRPAAEAGPATAGAGTPVAGAGGGSGQGFLASEAGRAALEGALRTAWTWFKTWLAEGAPGPEQLRLPL
jgi:hypothetical protein